jgi:undecaprenyl-diphosphatase
MNIFDTSIIAFLNESSHRFLIIDKVMMSIVDSSLLKGGIIFAILWGLWFRRTDERTKKLNREHIVSTIIACFFSLYFTRMIILFLPHRIRPMYNPDIQFIAPLGWDTTHYFDWSSFPSDHAVLFFTLAAGIYFIDKYVGMILSLYVLIIICFPRIYLGLHYPTDILAGALLGVGLSLVFNSIRLRSRVAKPFIHAMNKAPTLYYACFFLVTFEMGNLFWNVRTLVIKAYKFLSFFA